MKKRVRRLAVLIAAACFIMVIAADVRAQEEGSTPGAIANPGSYQGSMELQRQEQQQNEQQQQQNQQMLHRLDENYKQYAPSGSGGRGPATGGKPPVDWWSKPPLPPANNPLLGRWKQTVAKGVGAQQLSGAAELPGADIAASLLNSTLAGGCKSMFGSGVVAFEPNKLQWVAPDGHEEILNNVAYRASGSEVVVLSHDPGAIPALIFGFSSHDQAVVAFFNCTMNRLGAKPPAAASSAAPSASPTPAPKAATAPAVAAPPSGPANAVLKFLVGTSAPGSFTPLSGLHVWVTPENPEDAMVRAKLIERDNTFSAQVLGDCTNAMACTRDLQVMTAKALGSILTDAGGHAQTPMIPSGRYFLVGIAPYNGKVIFWSQPINLQTGMNGVTLDQTNASIPR